MDVIGKIEMRNMNYNFLLVFIIILPLTMGCLSDTKDEKIEIKIMIGSVLDPMIINYRIFYINEENDIIDELVNFTHIFTKGTGQQTSYDIEKRNNNLLFSLRLFNTSESEKPFIIEERIFNNTSVWYRFNVYNLGLDQIPIIEFQDWRGVT